MGSGREQWWLGPRESWVAARHWALGRARMRHGGCILNELRLAAEGVATRSADLVGSCCLLLV